MSKSCHDIVMMPHQYGSCQRCHPQLGCMRWARHTLLDSIFTCELDLVSLAHLLFRARKVSFYYRDKSSRILAGCQFPNDDNPSLQVRFPRGMRWAGNQIELCLWPELSLQNYLSVISRLCLMMQGPFFFFYVCISLFFLPFPGGITSGLVYELFRARNEVMKSKLN